MKRRPLAITVIGALFILTGVVALAYHGKEFLSHPAAPTEMLWVMLVRLAALVGGIFLLFARPWARWLLVLWMAYHVGLSLGHEVSQLIVHSALLVVLTYFLFRPSSSAFFSSGRRSAAPETL